MSVAINVRDIKADCLINEYALHLKKSGKVDVPSWVDIVKTGISRELPPSNPDWFFVRVASVARQVYLCPGVGVGALCKHYGAKKNNGHRPGKHVDASSNIVRKSLQALEKMKLVEKSPNGGRRISTDGQRDLDRVAILCSKKAF